ncbi:MAG TPA: glycoside hydrolase family 20 zincin-like fold domain-containing protein, partial [Treponemataceae bacterium]|nr:glycoside hydrolase family 20 zincin-like fold domain-containing protein [Treponemataceae bacterium]
MITETAFIPAVQSLTTASGWVSSRAGEIVCGRDLEQTALLAKEQLSKAGLSCTLHFSSDYQCSQGALCIRLQREESITHEESYELSIDDDGVLIKARTEAGLFYGIQSLRQLVYSCDGRYPYLTIKDYPSFSWRGFMI